MSFGRTYVHRISSRVTCINLIVWTKPQLLFVPGMMLDQTTPCGAMPSLVSNRHISYISYKVISYESIYNISSWWFQRFFIFHPYLGKISILTNIFQMGWNHHLDLHMRIYTTHIHSVHTTGHISLFKYTILTHIDIHNTYIIYLHLHHSSSLRRPIGHPNTHRGSEAKPCLGTKRGHPQRLERITVFQLWSASKITFQTPLQKDMNNSEGLI